MFGSSAALFTDSNDAHRAYSGILRHLIPDSFAHSKIRRCSPPRLHKAWSRIASGRASSPGAVSASHQKESPPTNAGAMKTVAGTPSRASSLSVWSTTPP